MGMQSEKRSWNMTKNTTASDKFFNWSTIYGKDAEHATPYQTRVTIGRLRFHIFHRGDADPDCHDHPWDFWTFPLTSYVEEVALPAPGVTEKVIWDDHAGEYFREPNPNFVLKRQIVKAFRLHFKPATHTHRVLGRWSGEKLEVQSEVYREIPSYNDRTVFTIVWRSPKYREWGFLKERLGKWCRVHWRDYVFGGGKEAPCQDIKP